MDYIQEELIRQRYVLAQLMHGRGREEPSEQENPTQNLSMFDWEFTRMGESLGEGMRFAHRTSHSDMREPAHRYEPRKFVPQMHRSNVDGTEHFDEPQRWIYPMADSDLSEREQLYESREFMNQTRFSDVAGMEDFYESQRWIHPIADSDLSEREQFYESEKFVRQTRRSDVSEAEEFYEPQEFVGWQIRDSYLPDNILFEESAVRWIPQEMKMWSWESDNHLTVAENEMGVWSSTLESPTARKRQYGTDAEISIRETGDGQVTFVRRMPDFKTGSEWLSTTDSLSSRDAQQTDPEIRAERRVGASQWAGERQEIFASPPSSIGVQKQQVHQNHSSDLVWNSIEMERELRQVDVQEISRVIQRDARRYDGGFSLY